MNWHYNVIAFLSVSLPLSFSSPISVSLFNFFHKFNEIWTRSSELKKRFNALHHDFVSYLNGLQYFTLKRQTKMENGQRIRAQRIMNKIPSNSNKKKKWLQLFHFGFEKSSSYEMLVAPSSDWGLWISHNNNNILKEEIAQIFFMLWFKQMKKKK